MQKSLENNSVWYFYRKWHQGTISGEKNNSVKQWYSLLLTQRIKPWEGKRWEELSNMLPEKPGRWVKSDAAGSFPTPGYTSY